MPRPIYLNVGRVSVEKNIEAFVELGLEGSKVIIGDGPAHDELKAKYPEAHFLGGVRNSTRPLIELGLHFGATGL